MILAGIETFSNVYIAVLRWLMPVLTLILVLRCVKPLLFFRREPEIWAWLCLQDGNKIPITHWENVIGRHKKSDIVINEPSVSRTHAVLTRYDDGSWTVTDAHSSGGTLVNDRRISIHPLDVDDVITMGNVQMKLQPISKKQEKRLAQLRTSGSSFFDSFLNMVLLTVIQILCIFGFLMQAPAAEFRTVLLGFGGILILQWLLLLFNVCIQRTAFEVETVAFFLTTMGMCAIATVVPGEAVKQLISIMAGLVTFLVIGWALRDLERAKLIRKMAAVLGIGFLVFTLLFGTEINGARAWVSLGGMSLQPSELSKVCFVFVGASAMDRIVTKRNLIMFIAYSVIICGCLALMNDFGTALIFFCAFLVIAYLRSGSVGTVGLAITALVFAGVVVLKFAPHAVSRFASWRHIWEDQWDSGFQQTQSLMCMAAGGFLGVGPGRGAMGGKVFAADSDMVIATLSEEWGLLMVLMMVLCIIAFGIFAVRSAIVGRSSFFTISSCAACSIMLVQVILNGLGTVDIVPLTGVTFPFLSNGGSSMICAWGLLAFIKAADTRQNASFAVRVNKDRGEINE